MGFIIKNTAGLINTRITDTGRQLLSQGNFNISYFQVGDSEVCYNCAGSVQPSTGFVLEPSFNAQNSTGSPQSNRENIKYPFYFQGTSGSTYGIPFVGSINTDVYNHTGTLGFFTGNTSAPIVYTAQTSSAYTITSNLIIDYGECVSASTIDLNFDSCAPTTGTPSVGDIVTIIYDGNAGCGDISGNYPIQLIRFRQ